MRKFSIVALLLTLVAALALPMGLLRAEEEAPKAPSIVDIAVADGRFSTLVAAVTEAGLADTLANGGPFTVFAPTDEAFAGALNLMGITASDLLANKEALTEILLYHVVPGKFMAADVAGITSARTAAGFDLRFDTANGVTINGSSNVIIADIEASNGVIHVIDNVLFPPNHLAGILTDSKIFNTLLAALDYTDLTETLATDGPFTIFAPTDEAFAASLSALNLTVNDLLADPALLKSILLYHVVPGTVAAEDVVGLRSARTLNGASISIAVVDGQVVLNGGQAIVTNPDLFGRNGVIHMISGVLLPSAE